MHRLIGIALANTVVLLVVSGLVGLRVNTTDSMPLGLYRVVDARVDRGVIVEACLPPTTRALAIERGYVKPFGACGDHMPVLKHVVGAEGDRVVLGDYVVLNDEAIESAPILTRDSQGRPLRAAPNAELGPDEFWLLSDHVPNSFDSRYFGAVHRRAIHAVMRPIWIV